MGRNRTTKQLPDAETLRRYRLAVARSILNQVNAVLTNLEKRQEPAGGWNWGHAGDAQRLIERLRETLTTATDIQADPNIEAATVDPKPVLNALALQAGGVPTYPVRRADGTVVRVTVPENDR